jgi:uncharacterized protein YdeI (YjbR/CyaY-like superfamily)
MGLEGAGGPRDGRRVSAAIATTFRSASAWRAWLARHHRSAAEIVVRCYKVHAASRGVTYARALDEALCFGWIDGIRRRLDEDSFSIRFTPRRARSIWSRINVAHAERLIRERRMTKAGLAAYEARDPKRTGVYSFEREGAKLAPGFVRRFRADAAAWRWFEAQAPWYRRTSAHWVMSAKREETRERRLAKLIDCCARRVPLPQLERPG